MKDVSALANTLRAADIEECTAHGLSPFDGLLLSYQRSTVVKAAYTGGDIICLFGVIEDQDDPSRCVVWLLGSKHIENHSKSFLETSRNEFLTLMSKYKTAHNLILKTNDIHKKWCRWLGFTVDPYDWQFDLITYKMEIN